MTYYENRFAVLKTQRFDSLHACVYWLDETGLFERDSVRNPDRAFADDPIHYSNVFGKTAAGRLKSGGAADFLVNLTLRECFMTTVVAISARHVVEDYDAVSRLEAAHPFADCGNYARSFVSKDSWGRMGAGCDLLQVGSADSAGVYAKEDLARTNPRDGNGFEADVVYPAVH